MEAVVLGRPALPAGERQAFPRASFSVASFGDGAVAPEDIEVICEHELAVVANGEKLATLLCSNANLEELVYGFLYSEQVIDNASAVQSLSLAPDRRTVFVALPALVRRPTAPVVTSGFGGAALVAPSDLSPIPSDSAAACPFPSPAPALSEADARRVRDGVTAMRTGACEYAATRGTHCSALVRDGQVLALFEDIGRHNTFDKLAGFCLLHGINAEGALLATTGRVSSEMMRKAQRLGAAGVASLSGPTDAAVRAARARGTLLAGYVNSTRLTLYA